MRSGRGDRQLGLPGFPIRTSSDHSLVADSPRLIAGSNVLHRLLVPRHPPCALKNLAKITSQMHYKRHHINAVPNLQEEDARVHYTVLKIRTAQGPATASAVERPRPNRSPRAVLTQTGSLRTQQRARPGQLSRPPFHPPGASRARAGRTSQAAVAFPDRITSAPLGKQWTPRQTCAA
jgi:hypothetical protein